MEARTQTRTQPQLVNLRILGINVYLNKQNPHNLVFHLSVLHMTPFSQTEIDLDIIYIIKNVFNQSAPHCENMLNKKAASGMV